MLWKVWAAVAAVVSGILLATLLGGNTPSWALIVLVAALVVGVAITIVSGRGDHRLDPRTRRRSSRLDDDLRYYERDTELIYRLHALIRQPEIMWLRSASFVEPWRDEHVAMLRTLVASEVGPSIFDPDIRAAVRDLVEATDAFLRLYDENTMTEPMMRDETWRMVGKQASKGAATGGTDPKLTRSRKLLRDAATEVCSRYDEFATLARARARPIRGL